MDLEIIKIVTALIVLVNPMTAVPVFLNLTAENNTRERRAIARTTTIAIFTSIAVFALFGNGLLKMLNISLGAFQVGGGILVLLIAISMMSAKPHPSKSNPEEQREAADKDSSVAVVPLAIPILIGPGSISTVIIYASAAKNWWDTAQILIAGGIVAAACYFAMIFADKLSRILGKTGINIINRIMGMLLAALSIEIIAGGIRSLFPELG